MSNQYYVAVNGQKTGPFSIEELKSKNITRETLVWTDGLENWTKAEYIPMLKEILRATPPPIPGSETKSEQVPPPINSSSNSDGKYFGYELAKRRERLFATIIESIIIAILIAIFFDETIMEKDPYSFGAIISGAIISAILGAIFYSMWGGNLGHRILGLKVISAETGEIQNNAKTGAIRELLKSIFGIVIIPVIWLLWDENKQNLYDKVVKTYVVKKK
jgi:uncharacterized RDD family membrane protein YckC